ncbi:hypothetical protein [Sphingomonas lenta]|uniref:Uncharacterized protein n=1 Tax=Sphingomonas lenta TaxID=1141887 RepID=A0A2A2SJ09_9SPHN|nr:hypothetical protein [Sphingomonas lenta]PAX09274.1 hypothetical protein CKY28_00475 [Sphingomonas lenta]
MSADGATPFELGAAAGADRASFAGDCPFDAARLDDRREWMRGFGLARAALPPGGGAYDASPIPPLHEG